MNFRFNVQPSDNHGLAQPCCVCTYFVIVSLSWFLLFVNMNITIIIVVILHVHA